YGPVAGPDSGPMASIWELDTGAVRLSVTLSPEPYRGFSGEGAGLSALASLDDDAATDDADLVSALLAGETTVDVEALAGRAGIGPARVRAALTRLGAAGHLGYDAAESAYFHRVLPYDAAQVDRHNPRLTAARALVDAGAVTVVGAVATVYSGAERYRVRRVAERFTCTCPWWARYRGTRGPAKHALA